MIPAIIVDDERHNRTFLRGMIEKYCPGISVVEEAISADDAYIKINNCLPKLVFLDIRMRDKSGFSLLKMFSEINFEVIFVSAYNKYAIRAFEFNAVGYILKPIDSQKLIKVVEKAERRIRSSIRQNLVLHFVKTLSEENDLIHKISVHHNDKVVLIHITDISTIEAYEESSRIVLKDNSHYYSSKGLAQFDALLGETENFIRINKSIIINTNYLKSYSKREPCIIEMKTGHTFEVSRRRKAEILKRLKNI